MSLIYVRESSEPQRQGDKTDTYNLVDAWSILCYEYKSQTPAHIKVIDAYLLYVVATGILQLLYIVLVRGRPYQYFVTGLFASFGSFFLAGRLMKIIHLCLFIISYSSILFHSI